MDSLHLETVADQRIKRKKTNIWANGDRRVFKIGHKKKKKEKSNLPPRKNEASHRLASTRCNGTTAYLKFWEGEKKEQNNGEKKRSEGGKKAFRQKLVISGGKTFLLCVKSLRDGRKP